MSAKGANAATLEEFDALARQRRVVRMDRFDALPADTREIVNNYGSTVVNAFMQCGVTKANHIRHLVETVLNEFSPTRGSFAAQGIRTNHKVDAP